MNKKYFIVRIICLLLLSLQLVYTAGAQNCWVARLANDISKGSANFKNFIHTDPNGFISYRIVHNATGANSACLSNTVLLNKVAALRADAAYMSRIGGEAQLEKFIRDNLVGNDISRLIGALNNAGSLAGRLTGALKATYDDVIRLGGSATENGGIIKLFLKKWR